MSMPPQGGWQPPPNQGSPGHGPPQPPQNWRQGPWPPEPPPLPDFAPDKSNTTKYLLIAVAVLLVVGVSIGATLLFTRGSGGGGGSTTSSSAVPSDVASANDTGPVAIITDEPTCKTLNALNTRMAAVQSNGWGDQRRSLGSASEWTPEQRSQVDAVATAMRNAADQMVGLAKQTPHRLTRELYEQAIAYGRAYADSVPNYTPQNDFLADVYVNAGNTLLGICNAIRFGAATRALAVQPAPPPTPPTNAADVADPKKFIATSDPLCTEWVRRGKQFTADTSRWAAIDPNITGDQWNAEQRATHAAALKIFTAYADAIEAAGQKSGNPVLNDFASAGALYNRAYVSAGDQYIANDSYLFYTAFRFSNVVAAACQAAGS